MVNRRGDRGEGKCSRLLAVARQRDCNLVQLGCAAPRLADVPRACRRLDKNPTRRKLGKASGPLTATAQQPYMLAPSSQLFPNGISVPRLHARP